MRFHHFTFLLFALFTSHAAAAVTTATAAPFMQPEHLESRRLLSDADLLQRSYERLHPGLYRYNTPEQMAAHFAQLRQALQGDPTLAQAYLAFSQLAASIRCGHTYANFYNQPDDIVARLFSGKDRLPFYFRWVRGTMIVTRNFSGNGALVVGSEIESINGVRVQAMLRRLMRLVPADGSNDAKRIAELEAAGRGRYEAFDIFMPLVYPTFGAQLTLTLRQPGHRRSQRVAVTAVTAADRVNEMQASQKDVSAPLWNLSFPAGNYAVLTMPTWAVFTSRWDWRHFIESSFAELEQRGTGNLVIDLRKNAGGEGEIGNLLLAHLTAASIGVPAYRSLVRYRRVPDDLQQYLKTWDPTFKDWGKQAVRFDARFYQLTRRGDSDDESVIQPRSPRFTGHVFVLIGAVDSSATFEFASKIRSSGLARLIGQTTGGNQRGINGGAFFFLQLPYSHIELDLPLIGQFPLVSKPDAGLDPDIRVATRASDIANQRDPEMEAARALMR